MVNRAALTAASLAPFVSFPHEPAEILFCIRRALPGFTYSPYLVLPSLSSKMLRVQPLRAAKSHQKSLGGVDGHLPGNPVAPAGHGSMLGRSRLVSSPAFFAMCDMLSRVRSRIRSSFSRLVIKDYFAA